jgi:Flp pilus assembly protein TadB
MDLVYPIAIVFGLIIFLVLITLISMEDQRAKIRLRMRLLNREVATAVPWKSRNRKFLDAVKIPDFFSQLVDDQMVIWSGIDMTHQQYLALWWLLSLLGDLLGLISVGLGFSDLPFLLLGFTLVLSFFIGPYFYLKYMIREREREAERSLPGFLDMLTFTVEAGLGLVPALKRVSKGYRGGLGEEMQRALVQIELGFSQREALQELATRIPSPDMEHFVEAILLSERLGTSLTRTMRIQANLLRSRRRQRAEIKAQTAPIRIIPALVFFFLPSLLLIYLAPPIINFLFRR